MKQLVFVIFLLTFSVPIRANTIYSNDFETGFGNEWTLSPNNQPDGATLRISRTPLGNRGFLGDFGSQKLVYYQDNLQLHTTMHLTFDLYVLGSWDGSYGPVSGANPDIWNMDFITTTFANVTNGSRQSYPDYYPRGDFAAQTGAIEKNTLGYWNINDPLDAIYHFDFVLPHTNSFMELTFWASLTENSLGDESWGLDNVIIETDAVPEPTMIAMVGVGLVGLLIRRRK